MNSSDTTSGGPGTKGDTIRSAGSPGSQRGVDDSLRDPPAGSLSFAEVIKEQSELFAEKIKGKNWSHREAARRMGMSPSTINRAANGRIPLTDRLLQRSVRVGLLSESMADDLRLERMKLVE